MSRYDPKKSEKDEKIIKSVGDWAISISRAQKRIYIKTLSYHAPPLKLSRDDLKELINTFDEIVR